MLLTIASTNSIPNSLKSSISNDINSYQSQLSSKVAFIPDVVVMVTWRYLIPNQFTNQVISFQAAFTTNYATGKSFVIYNYEYGATWNQRDKSVLIGYTEGQNPLQLRFSNSDNFNVNPYAIFSTVGNISKLKGHIIN